MNEAYYGKREGHLVKVYCARIYRPSIHENKPKTLVFSHRKRAFWACFRENWFYNFGHWKKKKWLKEQLSGLFITKSLNLQAEECTLRPRVNIIIFMHLSTVNCLRRETKYSMVHGGKIWKWEKNTIFLSPIDFFTSFSVTSRKKTGPGRKILYCFSSRSYPRSCLGRKVK